MNSQRRSWLAMMILLTDWALNSVKVAITNLVPVFKKGMLDVKSKIAQAKTLSEMLSLTGIAKDKQRMKTLLCEMIISITYPAKSYAILTNNNTLYDAVKMPFSKLMNMGTETLIEKAQAIHNLILPMVEEMKDAGLVIAVEDLTSLQLSINTFNSAALSPTDAIQNRKVVNARIDALISDANKICHNILDENIISFKPNNLEYVEEYKAKRKVYTNSRHTRLNTIIVNEVGEPQFDATVTVDVLVKDGKTYAAVSGKTDLDGNVIVSEFEPGYRYVTVSGANVVTKTFGPYKFQHGKEVKNTFVVAPNFVTPEEKVKNEPELVKK